MADQLSQAAAQSTAPTLRSSKAFGPRFLQTSLLALRTVIATPLLRSSLSA